MQEHYGIEVPLYAVESVTRRVAKDCAEFNLDQPREPDPTSKVQVTELDGSMVPIVEFAPAEEALSVEARADKRKRRKCLWKEVRVCTTHDICHAQTRYGACFGNAFETGCMMSLTVAQNGLHENTRIHAIADGAPWIAEQFEKQFGLQHNFLIDFYHLCEYLGAAAASCCVNGENELKRQWLDRQKERMKANRFREVILELEPHLEAPGTPDESAPVRKCLRYLNNRTKHLDYKSALARQLPIGSGEVESAHRHVVQRRLKLPGAWWSRVHADNVVQLRVTRATDLWNSFWQQKCAA